MLLYSLSNDPSKPCFVLRFNGVVLMLDCGISMQTVLDFLPLSMFPSEKLDALQNWKPKDVVDPSLDGELKIYQGNVFIDSNPEFCPPLKNIIDFSEIDAILISNYSLIVALPFITDNTGFKGVIYLTEPTLQIGNIFLRELVAYVEEAPKVKQAKFWKNVLHLLPPPLSNSFNPKTWRKLFSLAQLDESLKRVKVVGYDEIMDIFGAVRVKAVCSGYRLGSSNWVISTDYEKVVYISTSSTLLTQRKPIVISSLMNANALIMAGLRQKYNYNPETVLSELCMYIGKTVCNGGNVLLPCYPSGVIYDLFECISIHLESLGLSSVPMFFVSPVADFSLEYSNILAEWLSEPKQKKVYIPEEPFPHGYLVKSGRLKYYQNIYSEGLGVNFKQPCVMFCGHPSLRFGSAVHFVEKWGSNPLHTVILIESDFDYNKALAPFQPLAMKQIYCPIDTSLNFSQANHLIRDLHPTSIAVPKPYLTPPSNDPTRTDLVINKDLGFLVGIECGEMVRLPVKRKKVKAMLSPDLATRLNFTPVKPNVAIATITAGFLSKNKKYELVPLEKQESDRVPPIKGSVQYESGNIHLATFLQKIKDEGLPYHYVEVTDSGHLIHFFGGNIVIHLKEHFSHIMCRLEDEPIRRKLRTILMECLNSF